MRFASSFRSRLTPIDWLRPATVRGLSCPQKMLSLAALLASGWLCLRDCEQARPGPTADTNSPWAESANLDQRLVAAQDRKRALRYIAQEVAAGRSTLREAALRYRDLNAANPGFDRRSFECGFRGDNDEERCCRQVIGRVESEVWLEPERACALRRQLEAVLEGYRKQGVVSLSS
jgi:hypothetical protein